MKKCTFLFLILLQSSFLFSQKVKFQIVNRENNQPISDVTITSRVEKKILCLSNKQGNFNLKVNHNDTLYLEKPNFFPIHINVRQNNFDTSHVVVLVLNPLKGNLDMKGASDPANLQSFEYHFVHDKLGEDSHLKVSVMDGYNSHIMNTYRGQSLMIADIPLQHVMVQLSHKNLPEDKSSYGLKKPETIDK